MAGLDLMTLRIFAAAALAATTSLHAAPALAQGRESVEPEQFVHSIYNKAAVPHPPMRGRAAAGVRTCDPLVSH